ncbi:MAG: hypothetical protein KatS3mg005_2042 [Bryobacteraceae bacterium]|nr:MAG: hypothetical protein KatS3mg005_2042 [Bryobacteraceae bacterium]
MIHPTDPVMLTLADGRQVPLRLTLGGLRRIMQAAGVQTIQALMTAQGDLIIGRILYEALPGEMRATLTCEAFEDLLPADLQGLAEVVGRLLGGRPQQPASASAPAA